MVFASALLTTSGTHAHTERLAGATQAPQESKGTKHGDGKKSRRGRRQASQCLRAG